ncbi:MAG TPA: biotin--[acetyl-CoA-carboxylase] ligase [Rubrivivax sp.]|nr:biotin--[acetyl-CoA-carboxylase] ligase [Burkholderiales bacterium]HNT38778.1 biotin--[acetyl-CoA-carboxylase] ligase [Rubrivivax sp.]
MSSTPALVWQADALAPALQALLPGLRVEIVASTGSTNTDLCERLRGGEATPVLRVAEAQTAGRGRAGRSWISAAGASLTFSLALPLSPRDWSGLSLALGAALADAIEPQPARLQLKWPNDLWLRDAPHAWRKLGGILIETVPLPRGDRACVVGVGLNVQPLAGVGGMDSGCAGVQEIAPALDAPALLARVAPVLAGALLRFEREGLAPFAAAYAGRDLLRGRVVRAAHGDSSVGVVEGVAEGIDADGALRLRHAAGVALLVGGEVGVRPAAAARED